MATYDFAGLDAIDTKTKAEDGIDLPLKRLDGKPLLNAKKKPVGLIVHGTDSKRYKTALRAATKRRLERAQKGDLNEDDSIAAAEADGMEVLAACVSGWYGVLDSAGNPIPFSAEAVLAFFGAYPVAYDQAEDAVNSRARFTKA